MAALAFFFRSSSGHADLPGELAQTLFWKRWPVPAVFSPPRRIFGGKRLLREAAPNTAQRTALKTHLNRAAERSGSYMTA